MTGHAQSLVSHVRSSGESTGRSRSLRSWLAVIVAASIGLVSCGKTSDNSSPESSKDVTETSPAPDESTSLGWSIDAPESWVETDPGVAQKMWMIADGAASVNILTEDFPDGTDIDLQGYLDAAIPQLGSYIEGAEVTNTAFVEGDHHRLAILDYTGTVNSTFIWYRAVIGLDQAASKAVIVTFATADEGVYESELSDVTDVAMTLQID